MFPSAPAFFQRASVLLFVALSIAACKIGEVTRETVIIPFRAKKETMTCDSPFKKVDLAGLKACGDDRGKGHCYDAKKVPLATTDLIPCDGGEVCVPDKVLEAGGSKLKSCAFFIGGKPGVCMSTLINDINLHKGELQPDVCDKAEERCAPCVNPIDGKDTHICEDTGAHEANCTGGTADEDAEPCCHGAGVCMQENSIPEDQRDSVSRDVCPDKKLCAPAAMVDGNPVKCSFLGAAGVCLDVCFNSMLGGMKAMARADCGPTEVCLPCAIGKGQGVVGCD
jgi:hypothetical protein